MNVLITCHSHQQNIAEQLRKGLSNKNFTCYIINESTPQSIIARANLIRWCDVCIVISSRMYQRTLFCMEMVNYAKDVHKPIIAVFGESNFQPYGGLGAILASAIGSVVLGNDGVSENVLAQVSNVIAGRKNKKKDAKNVVDPATVLPDSTSTELVDYLSFFSLKMIQKVWILSLEIIRVLSLFAVLMMVRMLDD